MRLSTRLFSLAAVAAVCATAHADLGFVDQTSLDDHWLNIATPIAEQQEQQLFQPQQFRVLKNERVKGYAVRVKQPVSCEQGVQVQFVFLAPTPVPLGTYFALYTF